MTPLFQSALVIDVAMIALLASFQALAEQRLADRYGPLLLVAARRRNWPLYTTTGIVVAMVVTELLPIGVVAADWIDTSAMIASVGLSVWAIAFRPTGFSSLLEALEAMSTRSQDDRFAFLTEALSRAMQRSDAVTVQSALLYGYRNDGLRPRIIAWIQRRPEYVTWEWLAVAALNAFAGVAWRGEFTGLVARMLDTAIAQNNERLSWEVVESLLAVFSGAKEFMNEHAYLLTEGLRVLWTPWADREAIRNHEPEWLRGLQGRVASPIGYLDRQANRRGAGWGTSPEFLTAVVYLAQSIVHANRLHTGLILQRIEPNVMQAVSDRTVDRYWFKGVSDLLANIWVAERTALKDKGISSGADISIKRYAEALAALGDVELPVDVWYRLCLFDPVEAAWLTRPDRP